MTAAARVAGTVTDLLRHAGAVAAAERGQVHVVDVQAVRDAVGDRWARQGAMVEDFVIRAFRRTGRDDDFIVRVNDTEFVLIQPSRAAAAALSRASLIMRETLAFFIGEIRAEHLNIAVVDRVGADGLSATRVTEAELAGLAVRRREDLSDSEDGSPPWVRFGIARAPRKVVTVRRPSGPDLQAVFYLDPVWNLRHAAVVSFVARMAAVECGPDGVYGPVDPADLSAAAHAALAARRIDFLRGLLGADGRPPVAVHLPLSFGGLAYSGTRISILADLKALSDLGWGPRLVVELTDTPPGAPAMRVAELVAQLRPFARGVHLRVPAGESDVRRWETTGVAGLIVKPDGPVAEPAVLARLNAVVAAAERMRAPSSLYGVTRTSLALAAWAAGVTQLSGDCIGDRFGDDILARRFRLDDLYAARRP